MGLIPDTRQGKVAFFESKIAPWTTNAVAIGTTAGAVTALEGLVTAAQSAIAAQVAAQAAAKTAKDVADEAVRAMAKAGADIISAVRTKARTGGDSVYNLAQIPVPPTPSPKAKPGTPTDLKVELQPAGALGLSFKCSNPVGTTGTIYHVYRSLTGDPGTYTYLGGSGQKSFVDTQAPMGAPKFYYQIQAVRSTSIGLAGQFLVNLGCGADVSTGASVSSVKLAA